MTHGVELEMINGAVSLNADTWVATIASAASAVLVTRMLS
jgi:hypothetical protein